MRRAVGCLLLLGSIALAQTDWTPPPPPGAQTLAEYGELVQTLATAKEELMLATDVLQAKEVAEAVRIAMVERGVEVYLLVPPEAMADPASFFISLAFAGANVRLVPFEGNFAIVDRRVLVSGPMLAGLTQLPSEAPEPTLLQQNEAEVASYVSSFYESFSAAEPYSTDNFLRSLDLSQEE